VFDGNFNHYIFTNTQRDGKYIKKTNCQVWRISAVQQVILMFMFPCRAADVIRIDLCVITKKYPDLETS
jgi:hypothetical protein